jgi:hypothetical protein
MVSICSGDRLLELRLVLQLGVRPAGDAASMADRLVAASTVSTVVTKTFRSNWSATCASKVSRPTSQPESPPPSMVPS